LYNNVMPGRQNLRRDRRGRGRRGSLWGTGVRGMIGWDGSDGGVFGKGMRGADSGKLVQFVLKHKIDVPGPELLAIGAGEAAG
jgi:hypothetical protein